MRFKTFINVLSQQNKACTLSKVQYFTQQNINRVNLCRFCKTGTILTRKQTLSNLKVFGPGRKINEHKNKY